MRLSKTQVMLGFTAEALYAGACVGCMSLMAWPSTFDRAYVNLLIWNLGSPVRVISSPRAFGPGGRLVLSARAPLFGPGVLLLCVGVRAALGPGSCFP